MRSGREVQPNLSGEQRRAPRVSLYVDESLTRRWLYIGVLAVNREDHAPLMEQLTEDRIRTGYDHELHFSRISTAQKASLGRRWLDRALGPATPLIRFHVLGIDQHTLNVHAFGRYARSRDQNVYRRFLRTALMYPVKAFYPDGTVVQSIVHDRRTVAAEEYFAWHTPWRMRQMAGVYIATDEVVLVDSDHRVSGLPRESTFIQLIDLILGATRVCLEVGTSNRYKRGLAEQWLPLVERLTDARRRWNRKSSYAHVDRCNLSFFPRHRLSFEELAKDTDRARSAFYRWRRPALSDYVGGHQPNLWDQEIETP